MDVVDISHDVAAATAMVVDIALDDVVFCIVGSSLLYYKPSFWYQSKVEKPRWGGDPIARI